MPVDGEPRAKLAPRELKSADESLEQPLSAIDRLTRAARELSENATQSGASPQSAPADDSVADRLRRALDRQQTSASPSPVDESPATIDVPKTSATSASADLSGETQVAGGIDSGATEAQEDAVAEVEVEAEAEAEVEAKVEAEAEAKAECVRRPVAQSAW